MLKFFGKVMSLCVILIPQLKAPQCVISPTNGIRAHDGVQQGGKVMKVSFADGEREHGPCRSWSRDEVHILRAHTSVHRTRQTQ